MLLIWDIHITGKVRDGLLDMIKSFVQSKPEEKNLIFLGDFVYHFSYDRGALLWLFELFLDLYRQGKNIYILAGNHDWLGNSFVFEEGKKVFDLLQKRNEQKSLDWNLFFITEPELREIEGENILFMPYCLDFDEKKYDEYELGKSILTDALLQSKEKNEIQSGKINQLVQGFCKKYSKLTLIHHYYTNKEQFPGYRASFSYKDVALSEQLLDMPGLKLVSWHLHAPFVYKNYLCVGSIWATSSLENNQIKGLWTLNEGKLSFYGQQLINYLQLEEEKKVEKSDFDLLYQQISDQLRANLETSSVFPLDVFENSPLELKKTIVSLKVPQLDYEKISENIDDELRMSLADFRLKKSTQKVDDLLQKLQKPDETTLQSFWGWKELLKSYLQTQYGEDYPKYEQVLRDLKIL